MCLVRERHEAEACAAVEPRHLCVVMINAMQAEPRNAGIPPSEQHRQQHDTRAQHKESWGGTNAQRHKGSHMQHNNTPRFGDDARQLVWRDTASLDPSVPSLASLLAFCLLHKPTGNDNNNNNNGSGGECPGLLQQTPTSREGGMEGGSEEQREGAREGGGRRRRSRKRDVLPSDPGRFFSCAWLLGGHVCLAAALL